MGNETIDEMISLLNQLYDEEEHTAHIKTPILESLDKKKHGIMSAIMVRKEIESMMSKDPEFSKNFSPFWESIFICSILAMTLHTCIEEFSRGFIVDEWKLPRVDELRDPLFPTFLLILIDALEYIHRPKFGGFYSKKQILEHDIDLEFNMEINYNFEKFISVKIILEYKNQVNLSELTTIFIDKLSKFYSENWGITIVIRIPDEKEDKTKEATLFFLRNELKRFIDYITKMNVEISSTSYSEIEKLYNSFNKELAYETSKNVSEDEIKVIKERKVSYQVEHDYHKKQKKTWI